MSVIDRARGSTPPVLRAQDLPGGSTPAAPGRRDLVVRRLGGIRGHRYADTVVLAPVLLAAAVVNGVSLYGTPTRTDAEGTVMALAWSASHVGEVPQDLAGDVPGLVGWLPFLLYADATGAYDRAPDVVSAGRELMVLLLLVSMVLLWVLVRRLGMPQWAAVAALVLFSLPPGAVELHRTVSTANAATPWLIASFALALGPRRRLDDLAVAVGCFLVAVLTDDTTLLVLPAMALLLWRQRSEQGRRRALVETSVVLVLVLAAAGLYALATGTGLVPGVRPSGDGIGAEPVGVVVLLVAVVVAVAAARLRPLRPFAVAVLVLAAAAVLAGGRAPLAVATIGVPLLALLAVGVADGYLRDPPIRILGSDVRRAGSRGGRLLVVGLVAFAVPGWVGDLRALMTPPQDRPLDLARAWVDRNVPDEDPVVTDNTSWVALVERRSSPADVVWFRDPQLDEVAPTVRWVVSTADVRRAAPGDPVLVGLLGRGTVATSFGAAAGRVEVLRVRAAVTPRAVEPEPTEPRGSASSAAAGRRLGANPAITTTPEARQDLLAGRVDERVLATLAVLAATHDITVDGFPRGAEGVRADAPLSVVRIAAVDSEPPDRTSDGAQEVVGIARKQAGSFDYDAFFTQASDAGPPALVLSLTPESPG